MSLNWEKVIIEAADMFSTYRLKVEGGWLYRSDVGMEFVPAKDPNARKPPTQDIQSPFPMGRRFQVDAAPRTVMPTPAKEIIDAEFEEVPEHRVNGSEVITATRAD